MSVELNRRVRCSFICVQSGFSCLVCFSLSAAGHLFQVEIMSIELEEAKTKVAQFQKECEEYLVVIVQQKRDADEQQKACALSTIM